MDERTSPSATRATAGGPPDPPALPAVPSPFGRKLLAFEFIVLLEYWLAPLFLGITNYAGLWSEVGVLLLLPFLGTLVVFVLLPLRPHLKRTLSSVRNRVVFHGIWVGSFLLSLFVTDIVQVVPGPSSGPATFGRSTVYTPFGAWSSWTTYLPSSHVWITLNFEGPTVLLFLSLLAASSVILGPLGRGRSCPPATAHPSTLRSRLASVGILAPLGFITGCSGCAPLYFSALALIAPGAADGASAAIPLVPWIGFAGLLYLFGFWLAARLIHAVTSAYPPAPTPLETG